MQRKSILIFAIHLASAQLFAADQNAADTRLREMLKSTMLQLRDAQTQLATAQAAQTDSEQKNEALTAQVEKLTKQTATDKETADKTIADLRALLDEHNNEIAQLRDAVRQWEKSQKETADFARKTEAERAKLAEQVIVLNRRVADQQMKNAAMFKLGNEILTRYEKFGLGDALTAREPFVGITRVKFENLIQDYSDKLVDQQIKPPEPNAAERKAAPPAGKPRKAGGSSGKTSG